MGGHSLYGWRKDAPKSVVEGMSHAIILVGAEIKGNNQYVYWINPEDPNDPANPESQKIYVSSFASFLDRLYTCEGSPANMLNPLAKLTATGAYHNPAFGPNPMDSSFIPLD